jgi:tetratricopeptide (TPR) repeat protein
VHRDGSTRTRRGGKLSDSTDEARALFAEARARHSAHDVAASVALTKQALALDPDYVEALEHLGMIEVSRRRRFDEGLALLQRAVDLRPEDAGLWYSLGWCCEFAADAIRRSRLGGADVAVLYRRAADAFCRCLDLRPAGKLADDAADLLELVEDRLAEP